MEAVASYASSFIGNIEIGTPVLRVSAKVDYAIRALVELARVAPAPIKGDVLARENHIPFRFLEVTLGELRQAGLLSSRRGSDGGYWLAKPPEEVTLEEIMVAIEGALVDRRAVPPDDASLSLAGRATREVWDTAEAGLQSLFSRVTLADLVSGAVPTAVGDIESTG
jgi:Rrf2 family protein